MAHVISVVNMKGGVAKTTTSVALAEVFSAEMRKKVLVIDVDPQINATLMLLKEDKWFELNEREHTLAQLFKDAIYFDDDAKKFDFAKTLQREVGDVTEAKTIDLLPSSLDLIDLQDNLPYVMSRGMYPFEILQREIRSKLDDYDVVIIDCPPNLGAITQNGLRLSNAYIIPTIPDHLSTYGIPQIFKRVRKFAKAISEEIKPLGIVITKFQINSTMHKNTLQLLQNDKRMPIKVYNTKVMQSNTISTAAAFDPHGRTLRQKYGSDLTQTFIELAEEIWSDLESKP